VSYSIHIGQAELCGEWPRAPNNLDDEPWASWEVRETEHRKAPLKPDATQRTNGCHPGYSQWGDFLREVGLYEAFFDPKVGVMRQHPGIFPLLPMHLEWFEKARTAYQKAHPDQKAGFCRCRVCDTFDYDPELVHDPTLNFNMLRLDWLCWWTKWALENCTRPAIANH
jgi:hypothetical protein